MGSFLNGDSNVGGIGDKHLTYLLFTTSHDGSSSAICKLTDVRVVCNNTLTAALQGAGAYLKVKHTTQAQTKLEAARRLMAGAHVQVKELEDKLTKLAERRVKPESVRNVFKRLFGEDFETSKRTENKVAAILTNFERNDNGTFPEIQGTAYSLLNAITEYTDHQSNFRVTDSRRGMSDGAIRAENALFGSGAQLKEQALEVVMTETANDPYHQIMRRYVTVPTDISRPKPQGSLLDSILNDMTN